MEDEADQRPGLLAAGREGESGAGMGLTGPSELSRAGGKRKLGRACGNGPSGGERPVAAGWLEKRPVGLEKEREREGWV